VKSIHDPADGVLERLFEVAGTLMDAVNKGLAVEGLTPTRAEIIWRIGRHGPLTQRELSDALRCSPRNVTGLVDALEAAGLAVRTPHPTDRRATLVTLTERGSGAERAWRAGYRRFGEHLFADLDAEEIVAFSRTLDRILERLRSPETARVTRLD
jgi:DNA-binding MarR family transcriptional regulator